MRPMTKAVGAVTAAAVLVGLGGVVHAALGHGYDVSWPQCGRSLPSDGDFRIVGVNGGKPYEANPCLAEQYQWAAASGKAAFYMNTANPGTASRVVDWYGQKSPNANCSPSDEAACAYNYGYNAARWAFEHAEAKTGAAGRLSWWLDVELGNSWSSNTHVNIADLLGSMAYLRSKGVPVGIYSTGYQWGKIAGGPRWPDVYNWVAGARTGSEAAGWCGPDSSFTGGPVVLVQWVQNNLDHNHACRALPAPGVPPAAASPTGLELILQDLLSLNLPKLVQDLGLAPK